MLMPRKFETKIDGVRHTVVEIKPEIVQKNAMPEKVHQIMVIDRSGSMTSHIDKLINQVQDVIEQAGPNDIISIIDFSSAGRNRVVLKGVKNDDNVKVLLDSMRNAGGTTCFSEPMELVGDVVKDLAPITGNVVVTLFTDGEPYTSWSTEEEIRRTLENIDVYADQVLAINTIGYGPYYNQEFMKDISELSEFGVMVHSGNISEYMGIFQRNAESVSHMMRCPLNVISQADADILFTNKKIVTLHKDSLNLSSMDADTNIIYVVYQGVAKNLINVMVGDVSTTIDTSILGNGFTVEEKEDFFFAYASRLYYSGKRRLALDLIINNAKDKAIADAMQSAFTFDEVAEVQKSMDNAFVNVTARFKDGGIPPGYSPKKDAYCVLDLLSDLSDTKALYLPFSDEVEKYKRIGKKSVDEFDAFVWTTDEIIVPVEKFVWNEEHLNLSIAFSINGTVKINPKAAKNVGLPDSIPSNIFRTHTIIKDGLVNVKQANFYVSEAMFNKLIDKRIPYALVGEDLRIEGDDQYYSVVIDLGKLPVVNRNYMDIDMSAGNILNDVAKLIVLKTQRKVLNYILNKTYEDGTAILKKVDFFAGYTADQIRVLEEHGLSSKGSYNGVANVQASKDECDSYMTRTMAFQLKGSSSIPKVDVALTKQAAKKKMNFCESVMVSFYDHIYTLAAKEKLDIDKPSVPVRNFIEGLIDASKLEVNHVTKKLNIYKFATILNNDWIPDLQGQDGVFSYTDDDIGTLIVKVNRSIVYF